MSTLSENWKQSEDNKNLYILPTQLGDYKVTVEKKEIPNLNPKEPNHIFFSFNAFRYNGQHIASGSNLTHLQQSCEQDAAQEYAKQSKLKEQDERVKADQARRAEQEKLSQ